MDTFAELLDILSNDLNVDSTSSLYPSARLKLALNRSYAKAGGLFLWPETEDSLLTSTKNNHEYYDYPDNWRPDSMWKLLVDSEDYGDPLAFKDYLFEKENDFPSGRSKICANQWRRYFIYPTPSTNGNNNIEVYGQKVVDWLTDDADVTIFSYSMRECNEAVIREAKAILKAKVDDFKSDEFLDNSAKQVLTIAWSKVAKAKAKQVRTTSQWDVPNFFPDNNRPSTKIGDFDL